MHVAIQYFRKHRWQIALFSIVGIALAIRLVAALQPGYGFDVSVNQKWAHSAVELGIAQSYKEQLDGGIIPEYPPASQFIFASVGHVYKRVVSNTFDYNSTSLRVFIKLPAILADLLICMILFYFVSDWKKKKNAGLLAAAAYAFHPAAIYTSGVWGQTDSIYTLFLLAAIVAWWKRSEKMAACLLAIALLTKMHAVILLPLFAFLLHRKPKNLLVFTLTGIGTFLLFFLPFMFGGSLQEVLNVYFNAVDRYPKVSVGAYNFWWSLLADRAWKIPDSTMLLGGLSFKHAGYGLFTIAVSFILFVCRKPLMKRSADALFLASALLSGSFFLLLTQMHERYLFPFVALGIPLVFIHKRLAVYYWVASLGFCMNLLGVLPFSALDKTLFRIFDSFDVLIATSIVWMMLLLCIEGIILYKPFTEERTTHH